MHGEKVQLEGAVLRMRRGRTHVTMLREIAESCCKHKCSVREQIVVDLCVGRKQITVGYQGDTWWDTGRVKEGCDVSSRASSTAWGNQDSCTHMIHKRSLQSVRPPGQISITSTKNSWIVRHSSSLVNCCYPPNCWGSFLLFPLHTLEFRHSYSIWLFCICIWTLYIWTIISKLFCHPDLPHLVYLGLVHSCVPSSNTDWETGCSRNTANSYLLLKGNSPSWTTTRITGIQPKLWTACTTLPWNCALTPGWWDHFFLIAVIAHHSEGQNFSLSISHFTSDLENLQCCLLFWKRKSWFWWQLFC